MTGSTAENRVTDRSIRKFNPGTFQSDAEVIDQFVVRQGELAIVLDILRGNIHSPSCQHVLVVAPRGRGKTMLLARVAAELRAVDALSRYLLPVRFMEESHEIFNLADFWLDALFHLARASVPHDPALASDLRETHRVLSGRWQEQMLEDHARAAVLSAADRLGRKLLLMVENMQALHQNVDDDFGWKLRQVLQSEPKIMLLSSATSRFKGLDDATQPFFELFRIVDLEPLATGDCRRLWHAVTGETVTGREVRPLEILTGGSPRLLVIVAGFAQHRSLRQLMEELVTLVDEHTEYFRNHLEVLSKVERRVYLAVLDLWQPSKPGEIAARARLDIRVVSTMLGRLVSRGAVIAEGRSNRRLYSAAERLYSIYYKLRREHDEAAVVRNLIHFMVAFYTEAELFELSERLTLEAMESAVIREGLDRARAELPPLEDGRSSAVTVLTQASTHVMESYHRELQQRIASALEAKDFEAVIEIADLALSARDSGSSRLPASLVAQIWEQKAAAYQQLGQWKLAIATYDEIIDTFGDNDESDFQWKVVTALGNRADAYAKLGNRRAAVAAYDEVIARFGTSDHPYFRWRVAMALIDKGQSSVDNADWNVALASYDEVLKRFGDSSESSLHWPIAYALVCKGNAYDEHGDRRKAIAAYDEVAARFGDGDDTALDWVIALALVDKGDACAACGDSETAIAAYDEVIVRFGDSDDAHVQHRVAAALGHKGNVCAERGEWTTAIASYDKVVTRFGNSSDSHIQWRVATALCDKGNACVMLRDPKAAIVAYDEVLGRFGTSDDSDLRQCAVRALVRKGQACRMLGDFRAAVASCDEVVARCGNGDDSRLQSLVAAALVNKGRARKESGERQAALAVYDELTSRYGDSNDHGAQWWVALSLADRGTIQADLGLGNEALHSSEELEQRLGALSAGDDAIWFRWRALCVKTRALLIRVERRHAMEAFRSAYNVFLPNNEVMMHEMLRLVPDLVAAGAAPGELAAVLSSDATKSSFLAPLVVALREHGGEQVRAPDEVRKVAADVRKRIQARAAAHQQANQSNPVAR